MEGLASQHSSESCVYMGNCVGEALTGGDAGRVLSCERTNLECRRRGVRRKAVATKLQSCVTLFASYNMDSTQSETLCMYPGILYGSKGYPIVGCR